MPRLIWTALCLALLVGSLVVLESARRGVEITHEPGPILRFIPKDTAPDAPQVVMAHGFAGSSQMMQGYALSLAQAGYHVTAFDFEGHGRNPQPMRGDVTDPEGTTRFLVDQVKAVMAGLPGAGPIALVGHSMATDVLVRVAAEAPRAGPLVLISAFSQEITATHPTSVLFVPGAWETRLRAFALGSVQTVDPAAEEYETVRQGAVTRRSAPALWSEHVAVLHSRVGRAETVTWLNAAYGRTTQVEAPPTGQALLVLLFALVALTFPLSRHLPAATVPRPDGLAARQFALVLALPVIAAPLLAVALYRPILPVLVADYLALHLLIYGAAQLALLAWLGRRPKGVSARPILVLLVWGLAVFGLALDRYGANFVPIAERLPITALFTLGTIPFMVADSLTADGALVWQRILSRFGVLISLGIAVALDPKGLFFVLMIAPVIVLFFLVYGTMGRAMRRAASPLTIGIGLGLILAWSLGVSFPLFDLQGGL